MTTVLTPNLLEASELLGREIRSKDQMEQAALDLIEMGPQAVVVKGGHLSGDCDDCLMFKTSQAGNTLAFNSKDSNAQHPRHRMHFISRLLQPFSQKNLPF